MSSILIENGYLIPMAGESQTIEKGSLLIEGDRISRLGKPEAMREPKADKVIDASGKAVLPGLINTHTHLMGAFNKGLTEDLPAVSGGLFRVAMPLQAKYIKAEEVYLPSMVHAMEMVKTGTTCINETWWYQGEAARVVRDLGIRGVLAESIYEADLTGLGPRNLTRQFDGDTGKKTVDAAIELIEEWDGKADGRITCRLAPFSPDTLSEKTFVKVMELNERLRVGYHIHLAQIPGEVEFMRKCYGKGSVEFCRDLGILGPDFIGVHCVFMSEEEVDLMKETKAKMSHTAFLVGKRGYFPPMREVYRKGLNVSLGSDWLSNDMWKVMRAAILLARVQAGDTGIIDGYRALWMATMGGAIALGMENKIGSLEAGKKADIFLLDLETPWVNPIREPQLVPNIVYNANGSDVTHVIVDGQVVVEDGVVKTVDEKEAMREGQRLADGVWERAKELFD